MCKRVLIVTSLHPLPGAPWRGLFVADQVALAREAGHDVRVVVPRAWMPAVWERRDPNFHGVRDSPKTFTYQGVDCLSPFYYRLPSNLLPTLPLRTVARLRQRVLDWLGDWTPEVVHSHTLFPVAALARSLARATDAALVGTVHGWDFDGALPGRRTGRHVAALVRDLGALLVPNDRHRQLGIDLGLSAEQVATLPCHPHVGVEFRGTMSQPLERRREGPLRLLFPANPPRAEKDYPLFQAAADVLGERGWQVSHETFGGLTREQVWQRIQQADCMALSSVREGSPQVCKEALVIGTRMATVNVGDMATYLPAPAIASERTPVALADAMEAALTLPTADWQLPERFRPETVLAGVERAWQVAGA